MESCAFLRATAFPSPPLSSFRRPISPFPIYSSRIKPRAPTSQPPVSALKSPRGFGPPPKKRNREKKKQAVEEEEDESDDDDDGETEDTIPEIVTNRMMTRMGFSVGIPLTIGLLFFPFFYYLKVGVKLDIPTWVPFIVSFFFFGSALLGVSYGIVSSSWDPLREGSLLGWNEAQKNWPVFWQSFWGRTGKK